MNLIDKFVDKLIAEEGTEIQRTGRIVPMAHHYISKGTRVLHHSPDLTVREVHTFPAMVALGKDTNWCVSRNSAQGKHHFDTYNNMGHMNWIRNNRTGKAYLYHPPTGELKDESNLDLKSNELGSLKNHPVMKNMLKKVNTGYLQLDGTWNPSADEYTGES